MLRYTVPIWVILSVFMAFGQEITKDSLTQSTDTIKSSTTDTIKSRITDTVAIDSLGIKNSIQTNADSSRVDTSVVKQLITPAIAPQVIDSVEKAPVVMDTAQPSKNISQASCASVTTLEKENVKQKCNVAKSGIGLNLDVKVFNSHEINDYIEDIFYGWMNDAPGTIIDTPDFSGIYAISGIKIKGVFFIGPIAAFEPFGYVAGGTKLMRVSNKDHSIEVNLIDAGGGANIWARLPVKKRVSLKAGLGGYACYTILNVDGYAGEAKLSGIGYGINILSGFDITFGKVAFNLDLTVPVGSSQLEQRSTFDNSSSLAAIKSPGDYKHIGLEIMPGITFFF